MQPRKIGDSLLRGDQVTSARTVEVKQTVFDNLSHAVFMHGSESKKCSTSMCPRGHRCTAHDHSLWCEACLKSAIGDGLRCTPCPSGQMPNANASSCIACPSGHAGREGTCSLCGGNQIAATSFTCGECPKGTAPNAPHTRCVCASDHYNASR